MTSEAVEEAVVDCFKDPLVFAAFFKLVLVAAISANLVDVTSSNKSFPLDFIKPSCSISTEGRMGEAAVKVIPMLFK